MERQHVTEGAIVYVQGYEFIATDVKVSGHLVFNTGEIQKRVFFTGVCTDDQRNDDIRNTGYNGGRYGGNHLVYTWEGM